MNYRFQTPLGLRGKPPDPKPEAIPWYSSRSFLVVIPFTVQVTHLTPSYLPHLNSAIHTCLCWYFLGQHECSAIQMRLSLKQQCLKRNRLGDFPTRIFHPGNLLKSKKKALSNVLMFCHFDNKMPKTKHKEYWFHNCHNWKSPCPDGALWILHTLCSFGSGWHVFVMLCEHRLPERAGRVAGESWESARPLICVVAPSTQVEFPCKDPLLRKCSVQFWKTILGACNECL